MSYLIKNLPLIDVHKLAISLIVSSFIKNFFYAFLHIYNNRKKIIFVGFTIRKNVMKRITNKNIKFTSSWMSLKEFTLLNTALIE